MTFASSWDPDEAYYNIGPCPRSNLIDTVYIYQQKFKRSNKHLQIQSKNTQKIHFECKELCH